MYTIHIATEAALTGDESLPVTLYKDGIAIEFYRFPPGHRLNQWNVTDEQILAFCIQDQEK